MTLKNNLATYRIEHGHHLLSKHWQEPASITKVKQKTGVMSLSEPVLNTIISHKGPDFYRIFGTHWQNTLKQYAGHTIKKADYLVVGHTHIPEFSPDDKFINTGFVNFSHAFWLEITDHGAKLKNERYD